MHVVYFDVDINVTHTPITIFIRDFYKLYHSEIVFSVYGIMSIYTYV
jgi:hypothetical protein